ncbi:hypothetical protein [Saccharothrix longispora]|uniref:hypothetical protein n=1 Tax=Saccharothrix longispora TaxID=33920 RepID=UPI0028FDC0E4|nr:hypothetical protein [Saccharothrix longispora]MDU0287693.1 hypothetical protein [Saccharothrix longispora]
MTETELVPDFDTFLTEMVAEDAPRLFAVVRVHDNVDADVAAWGLAFADHAEVVSVDGGRRMRLRSPERAVRLLGRPPAADVRLVWVGQPAADQG